MSSPDRPPPLPLHRELLRVVLAGLHAAVAATAVWSLCLSGAASANPLPLRYLFPALLVLWVWSSALLGWETAWRRLEGRGPRVAVSVVLVPFLAVALIQVGAWGVALVDGLGAAGSLDVVASLQQRRIAGPLLGLYAGSQIPFCALLLLRDWRPKTAGLDGARYGLLVFAGIAGALAYEAITGAMDVPGHGLFGVELHAAFLFVPLAMALGCHTEAWIGVVLSRGQEPER